MPSIKEDTYLILKRQILDEFIKPDGWPPERKLCEKYGISRTPLREILQKLVCDGLLEAKPYKGYAIRKLSIVDIVEVFEARIAIEPELAALACARASAVFFDKLQKLSRELKSIDSKKNSSKAVSFGRKMHNLIAHNSSSSILLEFYLRLDGVSKLIRNMSKKYSIIEEKSKEEHLALVEALKKRDAILSERIMREHLQNTLNRIIETFKGNSEVMPKK